MTGDSHAGRAGDGCRAPAIVAVGASTGGPQALVAFLSALAPVLRPDAPGSLPVCVTLHMPRDLMPVIAAHVARRCGLVTSVVGEPCRLSGGCVFFAPGDRHLGFERSAGGIALVPFAAASPLPLALPPRRKSAVDAMFSSAAAVFGARGLAIVLSGMGEDGLAGSRAIAERGGVVLAQDRASSAVWGMPGAVAQAGLAARLLAPAALAAEVIRRSDGGRPMAAPARAAPVRVAPSRAIPDASRRHAPAPEAGR